MLGISIIVVCYNSETIIEPTIINIINQKNSKNYPWELVVVNNNSTDKTVEFVERLLEKAPEIKYKIVTESKPGTAYARFRGVAEAQFDILCFVDDDNRIAENWIETASQIMQNAEIGILGCGGEGEFEQTPPNWFNAEKEAYAIGSLYPNAVLSDITYDANLPTAGMCIRKEIFENLEKQNWKAQLSGRVGASQAPGEDAELCQAARLLGYKIFYTSALHFYHYMPKSRITWSRFLEMTFGFGVTDVFILPYTLEYNKRKFGQKLKYIFRKNWLFNYAGKKMALFIAYFKYKLGILKQLQFEKIKARNNGFCETILNNKQRFKNAFADVKKIQKVS